MERQARPNRRGTRSAWLGIAFFGFVLVIGLSLIVMSLPQEAPVESSSIQAATPQPIPDAPVLSTPTSTPTPTHTATPTPEPTPWEFTRTHLSIPSIGVESEVTEYTAQDRANNGGKVIPPDKYSIVWDSYMYRVQGILSIPSAAAQDCAYIVGHSYRDGLPPFSKLKDMPNGAEAIITTASGETLTYVKYHNEVEVPKEGQQKNPALNNPDPMPGCLKLVTCLTEGERDANGNVLSLRVLTLQLKQEPEAPPRSFEHVY